jgi:putative membrane protein
MVLITDLVLDPGAVALNFWQYQWTGIFYGVPFMNFIGWILTGIIASILAVITMGDDFNKPGPRALSSSLFLILSFWSAVCFYLGLYIPALIGVIFILYILYETKARVGDFGLDQAKKVTINQNNE